MSTEVLMPQMGESIAEGTIVRWMKKVGEPVDLDEPLFEISTDKVDAEIPSPAGGVLAQIRAGTGDTVPVNTVVALIEAVGEAVVAEAVVATSPPATVSSGRQPSAGSGMARRDRSAASTPRFSPVVRRLATEHGIDLSDVVGSGEGGRVTKADVLAYVESQDGAAGQGSLNSVSPAAGDRIEPMSPMRQRIAEHMVESRRLSAHVHTVFDVDFSQVDRHRATHADRTRAPGYLAYVAKAVSEALGAMPLVNASVSGQQVVYHDPVNLGIAVALEGGLIVPVIKGADQMDLLELDAAIADLAHRARAKRLRPDEVKAGTFTITNPGGFGSIVGLPIINQPQVAILCMGAVEKRPVVVDDAVVARLQAYLTLGFDHRLIDGAVADRFLSQIKTTLENFPPS